MHNYIRIPNFPDRKLQDKYTVLALSAFMAFLASAALCHARFYKACTATQWPSISVYSPIVPERARRCKPGVNGELANEIPMQTRHVYTHICGAQQPSALTLAPCHTNTARAARLCNCFRPAVPKHTNGMHDAHVTLYSYTTTPKRRQCIEIQHLHIVFGNSAT